MGVDLSKYKAETQVKEANTGKDQSIGNLMTKEIRLFGNGFSDRKKEAFYTEMGILLKSGIDIKKALELIIDESRKEREKGMYEAIHKGLIAGDSFSRCLEVSGKFTAFEFHSVRIGEASGRLLAVLDQLGKFYADRIRLKRQVTGALTYPFIVMGTAFLAVFFMLSFVVPMFEDVFKQFQGELPPLTMFIIRLSENFGVFAGILFLLATSLVILHLTQRKKDWYRRVMSGLLLKMPVIGELVRRVYLSRFCLSLGLLLSSRVNLPEALDLVRKMISFYPLEAAIDSAKEGILQGRTLTECLLEYEIFPSRMLAFLKIGEETNQMDQVLDRLANQYSKEVDHRAGLLNTFLEPVLIVFIGAFTAVILIAMYLPMFQMGTTIGF